MLVCKLFNVHSFTLYWTLWVWITLSISCSVEGQKAYTELIHLVLQSQKSTQPTIQYLVSYWILLTFVVDLLMLLLCITWEAGSLKSLELSRPWTTMILYSAFSLGVPISLLARCLPSLSLILGEVTGGPSGDPQIFGGVAGLPCKPSLSELSAVLLLSLASLRKQLRTHIQLCWYLYNLHSNLIRRKWMLQASLLKLEIARVWAFAVCVPSYSFVFLRRYSFCCGLLGFL